MLRGLCVAIVLLAVVAVAMVFVNARAGYSPAIQQHAPVAHSNASKEKVRNFEAVIVANANDFIQDGRNTFRFDTFGDEAFWGGALQLHQAIKGAGLGGVGPGISPSTALSLGLKVDVDSLPQPLFNQLKQGNVDL